MLAAIKYKADEKLKHSFQFTICIVIHESQHIVYTIQLESQRTIQPGFANLVKPGSNGAKAGSLAGGTCVGTELIRSQSLSTKKQETASSVRFGSVPDQAGPVRPVRFRQPVRPVPVRPVRTPDPKISKKVIRQKPTPTSRFKTSRSHHRIPREKLPP